MRAKMCVIHTHNIRVWPNFSGPRMICTVHSSCQAPNWSRHVWSHVPLVRLVPHTPHNNESSQKKKRNNKTIWETPAENVIINLLPADVAAWWCIRSLPPNLISSESRKNEQRMELHQSINCKFIIINVYSQPP